MLQNKMPKFFSPQSVSSKTLLILMCSGSVLWLILGFSFYGLFNSELNSYLDDKLANPSALINQKVISFEQAVNTDIMSRVLNEAVVEAFLVKPNGTVQFSSDSEKKGKTYRSFLHPNEHALPFQVFRNHEVVRYRDHQGNYYISSLTPVTRDGVFHGNLFLRISSNAIEVKKNKLFHLFLGGGIILLLVITLLYALYLHWIIVPRIDHATRAIEAIEFKHDVIPGTIPAGRPDQIGMFIQRINTFLTTTASYNNDLRRLNIAGEQLAATESRDSLYNTATNIICRFFSVQQGEVDQLIDDGIDDLYDNFHELGRITPSVDRRRLYLSLPNPEKAHENIWVNFFREDDTPIPKADNALYVEQLSRIFKSATRRIRAFEEIAFAEERYRELFSSAVEGIFRATPSGRFEVINPALAIMSGYDTPEEMIASIKDIEHDYFLNPKDRKKIFELLLQNGKVVDQEAFFKRRDGSVFPAAVSCHCVHNDQGGIVAYEGRIVNIEERKLREKEEQNRKAAEAVSRVQLKMLAKLEENEQILQQSLKEKEILLREIYHRTKNNMLVIISMLKLQLTNIDDASTLEIFKETENRIRAMSMVHEKLYQSENLVRIDLGSYIDDLVRTLVESMVVDHRISVEADTVPVPISIDHAVPLGLAVNEVVTNSLKHGFPNEVEGKIILNLSTTPDHMIQLQIQDTGIGLPDTFTIEQSASFGMQITRNLVTKQLNGTITMCNNKGTLTTICFTEPDRKQRIPTI